MSPKKMIGLSFAAAAAKLYEVFEKPAGRVWIDAPGFLRLATPPYEDVSQL